MTLLMRSEPLVSLACFATYPDASTAARTLHGLGIQVRIAGEAAGETVTRVTLLILEHDYAAAARVLGGGGCRCPQPA